MSHPAVEGLVATLGKAYVSDSCIIIRIQGMTLKNPLNSSQGTTRGAMIAAARRRKDQRLRTRFEVECALNRLTPDIRRLFYTSTSLSVWLVRVSPRKFDAWDGLPASLKAVVDGIADAFKTRDDALVWTWNPPSQAYGGKLVNDVYVIIERDK